MALTANIFATFAMIAHCAPARGPGAWVDRSAAYRRPPRNDGLYQLDPRCDRRAL